MRYKWFRSRGLFVGSGAAELAARRYPLTELAGACLLIAVTDCWVRLLLSVLMGGVDDEGGGLGFLTVRQLGGLVETGRPFEPYQLVDPDGAVIGPVAEFLRELQGRGRAEGTQRSYSLALLRWFRFLWAAGVPWDQATRAEARDFMRWLQAAASRSGRTGGRGRRRRNAASPGRRTR